MLDTSGPGREGDEFASSVTLPVAGRSVVVLQSHAEADQA
jgi:hypothetical protein